MGDEQLFYINKKEYDSILADIAEKAEYIKGLEDRIEVLEQEAIDAKDIKELTGDAPCP